MTCLISNCGHDERGRYTGGVAGDQSGTEWHIIPWYYFEQNVVLRHPSAAMRDKIAELAEQAASNNAIGYDQAQRLTFWGELQKVGYYPAKITNACEADCSSGVCAIVRAAGYLLDNNLIICYVDPSGYTGNMRNMFAKAGFEIITADAYLGYTERLERGDVLLNERSHTCIVTGKPNSSPAHLVVDGWLGSKSVARLQQALQAPYIDGLISGQYIGNRSYLPHLTAVDYTCTGSLTIERLQKKLGITVDGFIGKDTVTALQRYLNELGNALDLDGILGHYTASALQQALNKGSF